MSFIEEKDFSKVLKKAELVWDNDRDLADPSTMSVDDGSWSEDGRYWAY